MGYSLTVQAEADFNHIYDLGITDFGVTQGDAYAAGLKRIFTFLSDFPRAARERTELSRSVRAHPYKAHIIVYEIVGEDIVVIRIRHSREDWLAHPV